MSMTDSSIRFTFGESSLGQVFVVAGDQGISAILFGKDRDSLRSEIAGCLPEARPVANPSDLEELLAKVVAFIESPKNGLDAPLDIRGSDFEKRVWQAL